MPLIEVKDMALRLAAELGFAVFPLAAGSKLPRAGSKGFLDATSDPGQIELRRWWQRGDGNLAIATGPASGVFALDHDPRAGGAASLQSLVIAHGPAWLGTLRQSTPSGGYHLIYRWPQGGGIRNRGHFMPGLDIRGEGGYIACAPSQLKDGAFYEWQGDPFTAVILEAPAFLLDMIRGHAAKGPDRAPPTPSEPATETRGQTWGNAAAQRICAEIAALPPGQQSSGLITHANRLGHIAKGGYISLDWAIEAATHAGAQMVNGDPHDPWRLKDIASHVRRGVEHGYAGEPAHPPDREPFTVVGGREATTDQPERPSRASAQAKPATDRNAWRKSHHWIRTDKGKLKAGDPHNVALMLQHHPLLKGLIRYNSFAGRLEMQRALAIDDPTHDWPRDWAEEDDFDLQRWLSAEGLPTPITTLRDAVKAMAKMHWSYDPLVDYFDALVWDQTERLDEWLVRYAGAEDKPIVRAFGRCTLIAGVARVYEPGCKHDHMLNLEGRQGLKKSSLVEALCPDKRYYAPALGDLGSKDAEVGLAAKHVIEDSEYESVGRGAEARRKSFLSRRIDYYRPPYGKLAVDRPRHCIIVGTMNPDALGYLTDVTGNRRTWPVFCSAIDCDGFISNRDQIWAEAVWRFKHGEQWWLTPEEEALAKVEQADRAEEDSWDGAILKWAYEHTQCDMTLGEIMDEALLLGADKQTRSLAMRVGRALSRLGFKPPPVAPGYYGRDNRRSIGGRQVRVYRIGRKWPPFET